MDWTTIGIVTFLGMGVISLAVALVFTLIRLDELADEVDYWQVKHSEACERVEILRELLLRRIPWEL